MYYFHTIATFRSGSGLDQDIQVVKTSKKLTEQGFVSFILDKMDMDQVENLSKLSVRQLGQEQGGQVEQFLPNFGQKHERPFFLFDPEWNESDDTFKWMMFKNKYAACRNAKQRAQETGAVASRTRGNIKRQIEIEHEQSLLQDLDDEDEEMLEN